MDAITSVPAPVNEPVQDVRPGQSPERTSIEGRLAEMAAAEPVELTAVIDGEHRHAGGDAFDVTMPSDHAHVLGRAHHSTAADAEAAIAAATAGGARLGGAWTSTTGRRSSCGRPTCWPVRGATRSTRATMLGQAKTVQQAEIDAACELIDFLRFNVAFARQILADQPISSPGVWNRTDYRPLDGFVYAITPFNFTAIAGNLPTAPALMGNTVIWKPSPTQQLAAHYTYAILEAAGLPPGVINLLPGDGIAVSDVALRHPDFAGLHFTGSTATFQHLWRSIGEQPHRLPLLPADRGGDRRQGLHPRPPQRRPRRAAHRDDPRLVRVLRAEVLGLLAGVRAALALEQDQGRPDRADRTRCRSATSGTSATSPRR